jgi:membrane fusion protein (multidrug efflux system)
MKTIKQFTYPIFAVILVVSYSCSKPQQGAGGIAPQVKEYLVQELTHDSITLYKDFPAMLQGEQTVEIRPRISGYIEEIKVDEGAYVKKGQILFRLNSNDIQAQVRSAEAQVKVAESQVATAKINVEKTRPLVEKDIISPFQLETVKTALQSAEAQLAQANANLANARANLQYAIITSPTDGVIGTFPYRVGSLVSSSITEPLTTVSNTTSMLAYFSMNETEFLQITRGLEGKTIREKLESLPEVELILPDKSVYEIKGRIETASGIVDSQTGAINIRSSFANPAGYLRSGGSGRVRLPENVKNALLIPQKASYEIQGKHFVYVVNSENKVVNTIVDVVAGSLKDVYVVTSGLKAGDKIVVEGITSLRDGMEIKPKTAGSEAPAGNQ